jgi:hypothetical protein
VIKEVSRESGFAYFLGTVEKIHNYQFSNIQSSEIPSIEFRSSFKYEFLSL